MDSASESQHSSAENKIRFYLVDDDDLFHLIHNRFIKSQLPEAEIISFIDPREALTAIAETRDSPQPAILLLDLNMPYLSGWEWLDAFSKKWDFTNTSLKIFILSSSDSMQDRIRVHEYAHISGYLVKPLSKEAIASIVA